MCSTFSRACAWIGHPLIVVVMLFALFSLLRMESISIFVALCTSIASAIFFGCWVGARVHDYVESAGVPAQLRRSTVLDLD